MYFTMINALNEVNVQTYSRNPAKNIYLHEVNLSFAIISQI